MAARALKDLDAAVPPLTRALTVEIRTVHRNAGSPSFTHLDGRNVRAGRGTLAKSTLSRILTPDPAAKDQSLPAWSYYEGLLCALDVDPAPFQPRWQAAQEEWQARVRGQGSGLPVLRQPGAVESALAVPALTASALNAPVAELEPRLEPGYGFPASARPVKLRRRHPTLLLASVVGSGAAVVAVSAFAFIGGSRSQPQVYAAGSSAQQATPVLVTDAPPKTITGKIVRTWNQDANNGHGGSIGVQVFATPYTLTGAVGPRHDGDLVEVVCHTVHGRLTHERLDVGRENSTGWFEIYYVDRLWWVADHYISFAAGAHVPDCAT